MEGFPNPYLEPREKSQGELAQEYAALIAMASFLFGLSLTETEKAAIPILVGAVLRERKKVDLTKIADTLKQFFPKE